MFKKIMCVRNCAIEIALLSKFLHQELSDLYPDDPESVLVIQHVVLAKVIGEGGLEPSHLPEIPGLYGINARTRQIGKILEKLTKDGWIRQNEENNLLVPGDLFRTQGNPTIDHLNRMISQVYQSIHRHGDSPEEIKENRAVDKLIKTIWDEEAADNESMIDL